MQFGAHEQADILGVRHQVGSKRIASTEIAMDCGENACDERNLRRVLLPLRDRQRCEKSLPSEENRSTERQSSH